MAMINAERPYIGVQIISIEESGGFSDNNTFIDVPFSPRIKFNITNYGKSPAWFKTVVPAWPDAKEWFDMLVPNDSILNTFDPDLEFTEETRNKIIDGSLTLYFICKITYIDIFENTHIFSEARSYRYKHIGPRFNPCGPRSYHQST